MAQIPELRMTLELRLVLGALMDMPARRGSDVASATGLPMGIVESALDRLERHGWAKPTAETADKHPLDQSWSLTRLGRKSSDELAKKTPEEAPIVPIARKQLKGETDW